VSEIEQTRNAFTAGDMADSASRGYVAAIEHIAYSENTVALAFAIADDIVRSDVEVYALRHGMEEDGTPIYDTRGSDRADDHDAEVVQRAIQYIDARGDVFPWRMKRYIDAPYLVRFEEKGDGDH